MEPGLDAAEVFWGLLLFFDFAALAWLVMLHLRGDLDAHHNDAEPAESSPEPAAASLRDWLDHRANILISRRHKPYKHRHKRR